MKKLTTFFIALALFFICENTFAQPEGSSGDPSLYVQGGGSRHSGSPLGKPNLNLGVGLEINNNHKNSYIVGLNLDYKAKYNKISNLTVNHLQIPLLYKYNVNNNLHFFGGISGNYILGVNDKFYTDTKTILNTINIPAQKIYTYQNRLSADAVAGLEVGFKNRGPHFGFKYSKVLTETENKSMYKLDLYVRVKIGKNKLKK